MEYLKNDICKFKPLFNINYDKKINIISCCFFKMKNSGYKDFSKYIEGLKKLNDVVKKIEPKYKIRLFIDNSIYDDKNLYQMISKLDNVQLVLYSCPNYKIDNLHHKGLFGTMVRFFPMFDFINNDANTVVIADIDDTNVKIFIYYLKYIYDNYKNIFDNIYLFKSGPLCRSLKYKYNFIYKNTLNPYIYALSYVSVKRINNNIIIDYIKNANNENIISYHKLSHISNNKQVENKYSDEYEPFIYGIDEHFLNDVLTKYLIDNKLCYVVNVNWSVFDCLYYVISLKDNLTKKEIHMIDLIFTYIKDKIDLNLNINDKMTIYEKFDILDKVIYDKKKYKNQQNNVDIQSDKYKIIKLLYKTFLYLKSNVNYKFLFPNDLYKLFVDNEYFGIYSIDLIKIYNCGNKEKDIILNSKKFNHEDITGLKKFYLKYKK